MVSFCCLTSTEARRPIRDGDEWEAGIEESNLGTDANPEDQGCRGPPPEQQDVKAVSVRHCAVTTAPRNCCPDCYAEQSHKDNVRSSAVGKQLKQQKSNSLSLSLAQLHLPALDLTHTHTHTHTHIHAHTHARAHTHTHTRTHTPSLRQRLLYIHARIIMQYDTCVHT